MSVETKVRLVIFGSRNASKQNVYDAIKAFRQQYPASQYEIIEEINGCAAGADSFGAYYAKMAGYPVKEFPAEWNKYGKSAGFRRNTEMAEYADIGLCVWNGSSHGSQHMMSEMKRLGKPYFLYTYVQDPVEPPIQYKGV